MLISWDPAKNLKNITSVLRLPSMFFVIRFI